MYSQVKEVQTCQRCKKEIYFGSEIKLFHLITPEENKSLEKLPYEPEVLYDKCQFCKQDQETKIYMHYKTRPDILIIKLEGKLTFLTKEFKVIHKSKTSTYNLVGTVINAPGHDYSYAKDKDAWYKFNDTLITPIEDESDIEKIAKTGEDVFGKPRYLFYQRIKPKTETQPQKKDPLSNAVSSLVEKLKKLKNTVKILSDTIPIS